MLCRKKVLLPWLLGTLAVTLSLVALTLVNMGLNIRGFTPVKMNQVIAKVAFERVAPQKYKATIENKAGGTYTHVLTGDLWRVELSFLKWTADMVQYGYRLESIDGRYLTLQQEQMIERTPYPLTQEVLGLDLWRVATYFKEMPMVQAESRAVEYVPLADQAKFMVSFDSKQALAVKPLNDRAEAVFQERKKESSPTPSDYKLTPAPY